MKGTRWMLLAVLLAWALCANALAAGNGETTYRALLIGVDGYQTNALSGCVNDTGRMSQALQAANEAGAFYQAPVIRSNLQTDEILQLSSELETWNVDEDDVTFFYYAGHGYLSDKGTPAIVGKDNKMLSIADLIGLLDSVPGVKMVVLDCRYADSLLDTAGEEQDGNQAALQALSAFNQAVVSAFQQSANASNYYVLAASTLASSEEKALPAGEDPRGVVTYLLTQGCGYDYVEQRPTDLLPADANENGAISLTEARDYILDQLEAMENSDEILVDVAISPEGSSYPLMARRATSEVLEVTLGQDTLEVPVGRTRQLEAQTQPPNASKRTISWTSSDLSVATVDEYGEVTGLRPGTARIAATTANGLTVFADVTVKDVTLVDALSLNTARLTVGNASQVQLNLTMTPANATEAIHWSTGNSAVATVDENGLITCAGLGETYITVASESGVEATCAITVVDPASVVTAIQVNKKNVDLFEGETTVIQTKIQPAKAADSSVTFTSSDPTVAQIEGDSIILGVSEGECTVYATASSGVSAQIQVSVKGPQLQLSKKNLSLKRGGAATLQTRTQPTGLSGTITWESDDEAVATVENGKVTAVAAGEAMITARMDNGASAQCRVLVEGVAVKKVRVQPNTLSLEVGATSELSAAVQPENATIQDVTWSSGNEAVATVDENGKVTAVAAGKAVITASAHNGVKAKCQVTVKAIAVSQVALDMSEVELVAGLPGLNQVTLTAQTDPVEAGSGSLKWASSNPKVATVDSTGTVTAKQAGKAVIKATARSGNKNVSATCNIVVTANRVQNKTPIVGEERLVYTSARRIFYNQGNLVIELYFANRTGSAVTLPEAGTLTLTLADGQSFPVKEITAGSRKLKAGKNGVITYKTKVAQGDVLYGLDLRGASAQLVTASQAAQTTPLDETETAASGDATAADQSE